MLPAAGGKGSEGLALKGTVLLLRIMKKFWRCTVVMGTHHSECTPCHWLVHLQWQLLHYVRVTTKKKKKPDTKEDIPYNSKETFKDKQSWSVVLEIRRAFGRRDQKTEGGHLLGLCVVFSIGRWLYRRVQFMKSHCSKYLFSHTKIFDCLLCGCKSLFTENLQNKPILSTLANGWLYQVFFF